jgi:Putative restriction endonuclease
MNTKTRATIEDLYKVEGKAELVNGEIVEMPPSGDDPGYASGEIFVSLREYARRTARGRAFGDGVGFHVNLPHRNAFSPDAAYHTGPRTGRRFAEGAPIFAVEVRSEYDYGSAAERARLPPASEKRTLALVPGGRAAFFVIANAGIHNKALVRHFQHSACTLPMAFPLVARNGASYGIPPGY